MFRFASLSLLLLYTLVTAQSTTWDSASSHMRYDGVWVCLLEYVSQIQTNEAVQFQLTPEQNPGQNRPLAYSSDPTAAISFTFSGKAHTNTSFKLAEFTT